MKKIGFMIGDIVIVAAVILTAVIVLVVSMYNGRQNFGSAVIYLDGEVLKKVSLSEDAVIEIEQNGIDMTIEVSDGEIYVASSNCKNQQCVKSGAVKSTNQIIACIPNGVYILTEGKDAIGDFDFDAILG